MSKMRILENLVKLLKVKFAKAYLQKLFNENPYQNTLFGISNMLSEYGIKHTSFKVKDVEEIKSIDSPFMVNFEGKMVLVDQLTDEDISCFLEGKKINITFDRFAQVWDKIVLVVEIFHSSEESNYKKHQELYLFNIVRKYTFIPTILLLIIAGLVINDTYHSLGVISLLLLNIIGVYVGWLLIQKQQHIPNDHADRICSMLKKGNCNSVLASPAAKIMGVIGWSEIGLGYFISNCVVAVLTPHLIPYLALINMAGLPYSIWSVWYQKHKVKQWCPLCLIVQVLMWIVFALNLSFGHITVPSFFSWDVVLTGCIYIVPLLIINTLLPKLNKERYAGYLEKELYRLKLKPEVFQALLCRQPHYEVNLATSKILWGNKGANLIVTIVTNPHCYYCAKIHQQVEQLLTKTSVDVCIQYIYFPIEEKYESSNNFLVSVYLSGEISEKKKKDIYDHWFKEGRMNKEEFFKNYNLRTDQKMVKSELQRHKEWDGLKDVDGTPTIFINGYRLPYHYGINDLIYFLELKI